jgi:hypothetical protein
MIDEITTPESAFSNHWTHQPNSDLVAFVHLKQRSEEVSFGSVETCVVALLDERRILLTQASISLVYLLADISSVSLAMMESFPLGAGCSNWRHASGML